MVCSLAVCAQGLILNILIGVTSSLSGGLFCVMLLIVCGFQFLYGYVIHRKQIFREDSRKDIDLGFNEDGLF